jgi:hypothetical protein
MMFFREKKRKAATSVLKDCDCLTMIHSTKLSKVSGRGYIADLSVALQNAA